MPSSCPLRPGDLSFTLCTLRPQRRETHSKDTQIHSDRFGEEEKREQGKERQPRLFPLLLCVSQFFEADRELNNSYHNPIFSLYPVPEGNKNSGSGRLYRSTDRQQTVYISVLICPTLHRNLFAMQVFQCYTWCTHKYTAYIYRF